MGQFSQEGFQNNQSNQSVRPEPILGRVVWKPLSVGAGIAAAISAGLMYLETQQEIDYI